MGGSFVIPYHLDFSLSKPHFDGSTAADFDSLIAAESVQSSGVSSIVDSFQVVTRMSGLLASWTAGFLEVLNRTRACTRE